MKKVLVALALLLNSCISNSMDQEVLSIALLLAPFAGKQEEIKNTMKEAREAQQNKIFSVPLGTGKQATATIDPIQNIVYLDTPFKSDSMGYETFLNFIDDSKQTSEKKSDTKEHKGWGCIAQ